MYASIVCVRAYVSACLSVCICGRGGAGRGGGGSIQRTIHDDVIVVAVVERLRCVAYVIMNKRIFYLSGSERLRVLFSYCCRTCK